MGKHTKKIQKIIPYFLYYYYTMHNKTRGFQCQRCQTEVELDSSLLSIDKDALDKLEQRTVEEKRAEFELYNAFQASVLKNENNNNDNDNENGNGNENGNESTSNDKILNGAGNGLFITAVKKKKKKKKKKKLTNYYSFYYI